MKLGLLGYPLGHSFSKQYFFDKFSKNTDIYNGWSYFNFERKDLDHFFKEEARQIDGFNVTIPYKRDVIKYLDEISEEAEKIGAVNCIKNLSGKLIGYNTDAYGFEESLRLFIGTDSFPKHAFILGSGGASKAVSFVLNRLGIGHDIVSRGSEKLNYKNLDITKGNLIINTTPLGMFPNIDSCPDIDYSKIKPGYYLYDLVYNPATTLFLEKGLKMGAKIKSGLEMLHLQAEKSFDIWTS